MAKRPTTPRAPSIVDAPRVHADALAAKSNSALPQAAWIERMRVYRGRRERDVTVNTLLGQVEREYMDRRRTLGDVIDAWNDLAPVAIRSAASIASVTQGTLMLNTMSSSASYEVSRVLRDGLERSIIARVPTRVRRVKVRVAGATTQ